MSGTCCQQTSGQVGKLIVQPQNSSKSNNLLTRQLVNSLTIRKLSNAKLKLLNNFTLLYK